jgi:F0F1-type ATP synthase membrane subunit b/b'
MSAQEPSTTPPGLTPLPSIDELPVGPNGFDQARTQDAFDAFRRHITQLQVQLRVLQAAGRSGSVEPSGHALRMDALHLIRAAAEFADALERDAQSASAAQLARAGDEIRRGHTELGQRESELERYRDESERQRAEILSAARNEARELAAAANRDATAEVQEAEARANRLLEQARHNATELTNSARAEVEQTLEWARQQATAIMSRAQQGAEQLLGAAGLGPEAMDDVVDAILRSVEPAGAPRPQPEAAAPEPMRAPEPEPEPDEAGPAHDEANGVTPSAWQAPPSSGPPPVEGEGEPRSGDES